MSVELLAENVQRVRGRDDVPVLILCEHASNAVPDDIDLGIAPATLDDHWGWDRWAWDTLQRMARPRGITTLGARVSRLVLDVNRGAGEATLIRPDAAGLPIPGNLGLTPAQVAERIARFHTPYHAAADAELARLKALHGERSVFLTFHSFTGAWPGQDRDFDVGVLFDAHEELAAGVKRALATRGLRVRLNEPYSGYRGEIYSAAVHGEAHDVPYFELELNQHVLESERQRDRFARILGDVICAIQPQLR